MTRSEAERIIVENCKYIGLMQENIQEGYMVEESKDAQNELFAEVKNAKKVLAGAGIIAI